MSRIVVRGGRIFDGTGADPADGDVAIEDGQIVDVGTGLDGDEVVDVTGRTMLPGRRARRLRVFSYRRVPRSSS
jgi:N-acyl-D-aspartate/D-glutamate deacylase